MDKYRETFETWNKIATVYQDQFMNLDLYDETYDHICNAIDRPNARILELGCGPGNITNYLLSKRPDFDIFGIDTSPNMIELAKKNNPAAKFAVMDCRQIKNLGEKYDGIVGGFCLPYLSQAESHELISASHDLLNRNGLLYLSFVEGEPDKSGFKTGSGGRVYFYYHQSDNLQLQLDHFRFGEIRIFKVKYQISGTASDIHTILTARKLDDR
jgi:cyclopropane fatty-acyl-phospholipid synthase-like methyltransferase